MKITRRKYLQQLSALAALPVLPHFSFLPNSVMIKRNTSTGEQIPVVGLGTWQTFDVGDSPTATHPLKEVLTTLLEKGGNVVDSSPMYGRSEKVVGYLSTELKINDKLFVATKVWTTGKDQGIKQMNESFQLLGRKQLDLMQIHNLVDWRTHLTTLRDWKAQQKIRYIGITHYTESAYDQVEQIMKREPIDFLQINYSLLSRKAEERLLPLAQEKKIAVLINRPFEEGALFARVRGKNLPEWANEFDGTSWGQFFLKFILSHPAVTCVIPGTSKPHHMADNAMAGFGKLPDAGQRKKMIALLNA
ncbi:MAG: aldo/keto reductase [Cyclobacteriaceae bacterium]|nr:aldo/keto reductase [Cyclobacteriaceae bacterium]